MKLAFPHGSAHARYIHLGDGKNYIDRLDLRDHDQRFAIRLDEVAKIDLLDAGDPVDGRMNRGVIDIELGRVYDRLIVVDDRLVRCDGRLLGRNLLFGRVKVLEQLCIAG